MSPRKPPKPPKRQSQKPNSTGRTRVTSKGAPSPRSRSAAAPGRPERDKPTRKPGAASSPTRGLSRKPTREPVREPVRGSERTHSARPMQGLCYGRNPALLMLQRTPERVMSLTLQSSLRNKPVIQEIAELAAEHHKPVAWEPVDILDFLTEDGVHQGVVLNVKPKTVWDLAMLEEYLTTHPNAFLLALDQIQDPRNLGAIIRVAVAAGVDAIIYPKHGSASLTPFVEKASAGLTAVANLVEIANLADTLERLKEHKIWWAGAGVVDESEDGASEYEKPQDYHTIDYTGPFGLVMGSEGSGIRPRVLKACDYHITIPMSEMVESLNVSVAAGVILFEAYRQRMSHAITQSVNRIMQ